MLHCDIRYDFILLVSKALCIKFIKNLLRGTLKRSKNWVINVLRKNFSQRTRILKRESLFFSFISFINSFSPAFRIKSFPIRCSISYLHSKTYSKIITNFKNTNSPIYSQVPYTPKNLARTTATGSCWSNSTRARGSPGSRSCSGRKQCRRNGKYAAPIAWLWRWIGWQRYSWEHGGNPTNPSLNRFGGCVRIAFSQRWSGRSQSFANHHPRANLCVVIFCVTHSRNASCLKKKKQ